MDLFIRMQNEGFEFMLTSDSLIYHFASRSSRFPDDDLTQRPKELSDMEQNSMKEFIGKYGSLPETDENDFEDLVMKEKPNVSWSEVIGLDDAKNALRESIVYPTKRPDLFPLGWPKGMLLYGPPGTGKTLLARAVAGEAKVPFYSISGSDFVEMFVGVGAARVRDLFTQAKANAPAIVFVDEIDAVGRQRGAGMGGGHDEREQTLNQLLVEMDGFEENSKVILIAATNRPDVLDPALLRPGRFDRQIAVDRPDLKGREAILAVHAKNKPMSDDVKLIDYARRTPGFTGADLANVLNEAALLTAREEKKLISNNRRYTSNFVSSTKDL